MPEPNNSFPFVDQRILNLALASIYLFAALFLLIAFCDARFCQQREKSDRILRTNATLNEQGQEIYINVYTESNHTFTTFERPGYDGDNIILEQSPLLNIITSVSRKGRHASISHKTTFSSILIYVFSFFSIYLGIIGFSIFYSNGRVGRDSLLLYHFGSIALVLITIVMIHYFL